MKNIRYQFKRKIVRSQIIVAILILIITMGSVTAVFAQEEHPNTMASKDKANVTLFALIAAAVAFGFGALGAGFAIGNIGSAAMGAIGERPEIAGQALLFVALADGIAIFGFITALMILNNIPK